MLASWNGLMLAAFAEAAAAFALDGQTELGDRYRRIAEKNVDFLLHQLQTDDGRLFHTWKRRPEQGEGASGENGAQGRAGRARVDGFLEDYAHLRRGPAGPLAGRPSTPAGTRPLTTCSVRHWPASRWRARNCGLSRPTDTLFEPPAASASVGHAIKIRIPDCRQACDALGSRGAELLTPPIDQGAGLRAFFRNPEELSRESCLQPGMTRTIQTALG